MTSHRPFGRTTRSRRLFRASVQSGVVAACALPPFAVVALAQEARMAIPLDPVTAIVDAFHDHDIVALGEGAHGNEQGHAFRLALIRDPRFLAAVDDIVVEFDNALYQDVMDRFTDGEDVDIDVLQRVWQNTTQVTPVWDLPIYEAFFRAVQDVNRSRPPPQRLRVLLGDPPIDWDTVRLPSQVAEASSDRGRHVVDVIRREVLAKRRTALVIYGDAHIWRMSPISMVRRLEDEEASVFALTTPHMADLAQLQSDVASWEAPRLVVIAGTVLGEAPFSAYIPIPGDRGRLQDNADGLLYLGHPSSITMSRLAPALCEDDSYMRMRMNRLALMPRPPGAPDFATRAAEQLERYCASVTSR